MKLRRIYLLAFLSSVVVWAILWVYHTVARTQPADIPAPVPEQQNTPSGLPIPPHQQALHWWWIVPALVIVALIIIELVLSKPITLTMQYGEVSVSLLLLIVYALVLILSVGGQLGLRREHVIELLSLVVIFLCGLWFLTQLLLLLPDHKRVWDDSLMFMRYTYNMRQHGVIAWNVADGPVYGSTELLHLFFVWGLSFFIDLNTPHLILMIASMLSGVLFFLLLVVMVWRFAPQNRTSRLLVLMVVCIGLAAQTDSLIVHFVSGMGTTFVLWYLTAYILLVDAYRRKQSRFLLILTVLWGGFAFIARPDLLLFSVILPAALVLTATNKQTRRAARILFLGTVLTAICLMVIAFLYFGTPLPLSFFAKSGHIYGESTIYALVQPASGRFLREYLLLNIPFLLTILAGILAGPKRFMQRIGVVGSAASIAAVLYTFYYLFFVMQIMGDAQRFYYPTLPVISFLAVLAAVRVLDVEGHRYKINLHRPVRWGGAVGIALIVVVPVLVLPKDAIQEDLFWAFHPDRKPFYQPDAQQIDADWHHHWYAIGAFSALSPDLVVATTEVGLPAVMNYQWQVIDLSGLNNESIALQGFSAERLVMDIQPDVIYIPFNLYTEMLLEMQNYPKYAEEYTIYPADQLDAAMGVAIRKSSPYYEEMLDIIERAILSRSKL